jgi:ribose 5-phosphate isomerase B
MTPRLAVGSDHAGFSAKVELVRRLRRAGYPVDDLGASSEGISVDYPDYAFRVARAVAAGRADRGILLCGTGIGMSIAANRVPGVRAAVVWSPAVARLAAEHNRANVLCLAGRFFSHPRRWAMVRTWLEAVFEGGRHRRRLAKISRCDSRGRAEPLHAA